MSSLKRQVSSSSYFSSFFSIITYNSSVSLYLIHFRLWTKGSQGNSNFDTFKCSYENLLNSSCHFPNHELVILQILHDSSLSWNILGCLSQTLHILHKREQSKCNFFYILVLRSKFITVLSFLKQKISFSSNFPPPFGIMRHISSMLFLAETLYTLNKSSLSKYKFGEISPELSKNWNFALWWALFVEIV